MDDLPICPFSKSIAGRWAQCPHARLADHRSGRMFCTLDDVYRDECQRLLATLKEKSRFVLGQAAEEQPLTHAQVMKIQCGGLQGMQRVLGLDAASPPVVVEVLVAATEHYGDIERFPYGEIVQDIRAFTHRGK